jgi:Family of unknown function (DUF6445)
MHKTLIENIKGYIDIYSDNFINGWVFDSFTGNRCHRLRVINLDGIIFDLSYGIQRSDVERGYKNANIIDCGFRFYNNTLKTQYFEIQTMVNEQWKPIFIINKHKKIIAPELNDNIPDFLVVDQFYKDPDQVRSFALSQEFISHPQFHKGKRTDQVFRFEGIKEKIEYYMNRKIKDWNAYGVNGCFQTCIAGDQLVYHYDTQDYAAIIFLTPDAPPGSGTSFYRSKYTKETKISENANTGVIFKNGFLDSTQFELVDQVGNIYNRLVIFNSRMIHAASCYFGTNDENGRLFQMFFFDLEK